MPEWEIEGFRFYVDPASFLRHLLRGLRDPGHRAVVLTIDEDNGSVLAVDFAREGEEYYFRDPVTQADLDRARPTPEQLEQDRARGGVRNFDSLEGREIEVSL